MNAKRLPRLNLVEYWTTMSDNKFVHLHNHSYYSLLDGLSSIEELVECAKDQGYKSLAITDHGTCGGLYRFQKVCNENAIKPILGMEAYFTDDHTIKDKTAKKYSHLILLAKKKIGYKNLINLSSFAYINGFYYKPRIDFKILEKYKEGLIVTSACPQGEIPSLLWEGKEEEASNVAGKFKEVWGEDFYIELMMHSYDRDPEQQAKEKKLCGQLYKFAKKMGIKAICTNDTHYAMKDDWEYQDILLAIQTHAHIKDPDRFSFCSRDFYLKPYEEMAQLYSKAPELLLNTLEIDDKIESNIIETSKDLLPRFNLPEGYTTEADYLKALVKDGMREKGLIDKKEYRERIRYEIDVITKCKYEKYFLIIWDIINYAKRQGIRVGIGRGSAVGSLCLFVLGITKLDPIKHDLIFERFLNLDRISPPDVDVDFDYSRRDEIYNYLYQKYGVDHCAKIGTYNSYKARAAIRYTTKALDIGNDWETYQEKKKKNPNAKIEMTKNSLNMADEMAKAVPLKSPTLADALKHEESLRSYQSKYPLLFKAALKMEGVLSSSGVHPAGVMASKDVITDHIPLKVSNGVICSQYDMSEVEELGLLKFDLLAIKTLTVVDKTLKMIKEMYPKSENVQKLDIDQIEPNDPKVFAILNGENPYIDTKGIFQLEGHGISNLLRNIHVDSFEDIVVANALFRPGPLGAGVHDMYCNYKHGREKIKYLHPKMGEALKDTYGMMIFQENVMKVAQKLAGMTGGQSDVLRYAVGKKKEKLMKEQKEVFVNGCIKNGIEKEIAEKIFAQIDYFSGYGFNKCLSGDTLVLNKVDNKTYSLKEIASDKNIPIVLDSCIGGEIVEDELVEVFETGEKELYEVKLDNGMVIKCTLDHKFYCSDEKPHTVREIVEEKLDVLYEENNEIKEGK